VSRRAVGLVAAASLASAALFAAPSSARPTAPIEASLLGGGTFHAFVQYDSPVTAADVAALNAVGITRLHAFQRVNAVAVVAPTALLRKAAALTGVTAVIKDNGLDLHLDKSKKAIRVPQVRAAKSKGGLGLTGKGVTVAVIDSGIDNTHPDLADRVKATFNFEGGWAFDAYQDGSITNEVAEGTGPYAGVDEVGHGTHVASTIAGTGEAAKMQGLSGADYSGVAPEASLVGFKVASLVQGVQYDIGWEANAMAALEYLMEHNKALGVSIVHNSWGIFEVDDPDSEPVIQMIRAAVDSGLIVVFSAGNNGSGKNTVGWPGAMGNVITVGSTVKTAPYGMSGFSSRGPQVDVTAPGSNIVAARSHGAPIDFGNTATPTSDLPFYMAISGTSMSSPHVSGVIALMKQAYPRLTGEVAEEILARTARDLGSRGKDDDYGWGFVDALRATKVAACLSKTAKASRESCFGAQKALARGKYKSDWKTKGDEAPTANGSRPSPV
jgi:subtilisin family serine protease